MRAPSGDHAAILLFSGVIGEAHGSATGHRRDPDRILAIRRMGRDRQPAAVRGKGGVQKPSDALRKGGLSEYGAFGAIAFVQPDLEFSMRRSFVNETFALRGPQRPARRS